MLIQMIITALAYASLAVLLCMWGEDWNRHKTHKRINSYKQGVESSFESLTQVRVFLTLLVGRQLFYSWQADQGASLTPWSDLVDEISFVNLAKVIAFHSPAHLKCWVIWEAQKITLTQLMNTWSICGIEDTAQYKLQHIVRWYIYILLCIKRHYILLK